MNRNLGLGAMTELLFTEIIMSVFMPWMLQARINRILSGFDE